MALMRVTIEKALADIKSQERAYALEERKLRRLNWQIAVGALGAVAAWGGVCIAAGVAIGHGWK